MATRIQHPDTAFALIGGRKRPREHDAAHLAFVSGLPCLICGRHGVHVAHLRYGSLRHGKRATGGGEKPSDWATVPLCPEHHLTGPDAQHNTGDEQGWWAAHGIDPLVIAALLWVHTGDHEAAELVCAHAREICGGENDR